MRLKAIFAEVDVMEPRGLPSGEQVHICGAFGPVCAPHSPAMAAALSLNSSAS
jgi:hypothetical protein